MYKKLTSSAKRKRDSISRLHCSHPIVSTARLSGLHIINFRNDGGKIEQRTSLIFQSKWNKWRSSLECRRLTYLLAFAVPILLSFILHTVIILSPAFFDSLVKVQKRGGHIKVENILRTNLYV